MAERTKEKPRTPPKVVGPSSARQGERLGPKFTLLTGAFGSGGFAVEPAEGKEIDPELVLVFDLAGTVKDLHRAIENLPGLEFLSEYVDEDMEPDEDFHMVKAGARADDLLVSHSLNVVASNAAAAGELVRLFQDWRKDKMTTFPLGLAPFKNLFGQLVDLRRWGVQDRIRESGLLESWAEDLAVVSQSGGPVDVEIELWYWGDTHKRQQAEQGLTAMLTELGASVVARCDIPEIKYHAVLASMPRHVIATALENGAETISFLVAEQVMFASPHRPMALDDLGGDSFSEEGTTVPKPSEELPRIALLDGLPLVNHELLTDRLIVDDPDGYGDDYPLALRRHGTAMASLIVRGDLGTGEEPLSRPLYVRPVLRPAASDGLAHDRRETIQQSVLLPDLLHRAIRRIVEGEGDHPAAASSVRIINVSIGVPARAFVRRVSPVGRLLDWLAVEYNLLIIVSAGNYPSLDVATAFMDGGDTMRAEAMKAYLDASRARGLLPPADALNVLTVGATHDDSLDAIALPDTVVDPNKRGYPALYSATGPGVQRSIKPDLLHPGGRGVFVRPVSARPGDAIGLRAANTALTGPGHRVAAPLSGGGTDGQRFLSGTSNATALMSREASRLFDILERGSQDEAEFAFPDQSFHPILVRALLVHAAGWGSLGSEVQRFMDVGKRKERADLANILGYGVYDRVRSGAASSSRAVLLGWGWIRQDEEAIFTIPMPPSMRAKADWHRLTVTLATQTPTVGSLNRYRVSKAYFHGLDDHQTGGKRRDADWQSVRRGTCQHEVFEGVKTVAPGSASLPLRIQCRKDAQVSDQPTRYGLAVSVETAPQTSTTVYEEIKQALVQARAQARIRP
jgi:hypothetical protein